MDRKNEGKYLYLGFLTMTQPLSQAAKLKSELTRSILRLNDGSELDFRESYLKDLSVERLKHIRLYAETVRLRKA